MSRKYKLRDQEALYFVSFATVHWIDLFVRPEYSLVLLDSLEHCQKEKGLEIGAWCIMPSHVHLIMGTSKNPMQDIIRDLKSFTSRKLKELIHESSKESRKQWIVQMMKQAGLNNGNNNEWQLWQQNNHPIELNTNDKLLSRLHYLHNNPVKAGFVEQPEHWRYSSAIDYAGGVGLLKIELIF